MASRFWVSGFENSSTSGLLAVGLGRGPNPSGGLVLGPRRSTISVGEAWRLPGVRLNKENQKLLWGKVASQKGKYEDHEK